MYSIPDGTLLSFYVRRSLEPAIWNRINWRESGGFYWGNMFSWQIPRGQAPESGIGITSSLGGTGDNRSIPLRNSFGWDSKQVGECLTELLNTFSYGYGGKSLWGHLLKKNLAWDNTGEGFFWIATFTRFSTGVMRGQVSIWRWNQFVSHAGIISLGFHTATDMGGDF